jgi:hypothetical protein
VIYYSTYDDKIRPNQKDNPSRSLACDIHAPVQLQILTSENVTATSSVVLDKLIVTQAGQKIRRLYGIFTAVDCGHHGCDVVYSFKGATKVPEERITYIFRVAGIAVTKAHHWLLS